MKKQLLIIAASLSLIPVGNSFAEENQTFFKNGETVITGAEVCNQSQADNYICNLYPCLSICGGILDVPLTEYVGDDSDPFASVDEFRGGCAYLKIISPSTIYEGYPINDLQLNSDSSWNLCDFK